MRKNGGREDAKTKNKRKCTEIWGTRGKKIIFERKDHRKRRY
jgi:hypothetical protein